MKKDFRQAIIDGTFAITYEMVPGRGAAEEFQLKEIEEVKRIYATGLVHAISVADNPGGHPAILADVVAAELVSEGIPALLHFTCKDRNRNQILAQLYAMQRSGLQNLLVMTGDYIGQVWQGSARPVFDLDPIHMLQLISEMNDGLEVTTFRGTKKELPTSFYAGAVVSPFKWTEAETMAQYYKLEKKIAAGAKFAISQIGYDARKMAEIPRYLKKRGYDFPLLANIYVMSAGAARYMRTGKVPGCYVSDELMQVLDQESRSDDNGKAAYLKRAAKTIAVARGLGYAGAHIGGLNLKAEDIVNMLSMSDDYYNDWQRFAEELCFGQADGFYLFDAADDMLSPLDNWSRDSHLISLIDDKEGFRENYEFIKKRGILACPKDQRNGPCGGSLDEWCELYLESRRCVYIKAYHQLKASGELEKVFGWIHPPIDWGI